MAGIPPLRYLRKSTALLALIFSVFFIHRLLVGFVGSPAVTGADSMPPLAQSVICRNIVNGSPFGVDSVFMAGRTRVYVVSSWKSHSLGMGDTLRHIWYKNGDVIQSEDCGQVEDVCASSAAPEILLPGDWSVDLVLGRRLLSSRQFRVSGAGP